MAEICVNAAFELSIHIGQRVRHQDYKGQRVTGVVEALSAEGGALKALIVLDAPIVIPPHVEGDSPINIYRQNVPAHELAPFDDRDELINELRAALSAYVAYDEFINGAEGDPSTDRLQVARAAIAKATGSAA